MLGTTCLTAQCWQATAACAATVPCAELDGVCDVAAESEGQQSRYRTAVHSSAIAKTWTSAVSELADSIDQCVMPVARPTISDKVIVEMWVEIIHPRKHFRGMSSEARTESGM